jgi:acetyltransferase-like isoleucine patch superfamily enzyme
LGFSSYVGPNSYVNGKIGKFCSIGSNVRFVIGTHPINYVSTSPLTYSTKVECPCSFGAKDSFGESKYADKEKKFHILIGNDVWIGSNALILEGLTIGDGAIIGAGSVVTKNVPPYAVVAGVPANIIKYRFNDKQIAFLLGFKWWDKDAKWIKLNTKHFSNIDEFIVVNSYDCEEE